MNNTTKQNEHIAPTTTKEDSTTLSQAYVPLNSKLIWLYGYTIN